MVIGIAVWASLFPVGSVEAGFLVGALNVIAGGAKGTATKDPNAFRGVLQDATGKVFKTMSDSLETTAKGIFNGGFSQQPEGKDPATFIEDTFKDGTLVDKKLVDPIVSKWVDKTASYMVG